MSRDRVIMCPCLASIPDRTDGPSGMTENEERRPYSSSARPCVASNWLWKPPPK